MKGIGSKIGAGVFFAAWLFLGLKGCVGTGWTSPSELETYSLHGGDGRSLVMVFLPKNKTLIVYMEDKPPFTEAVLAEMRGSYGTHYFSGFWNVGGIFGYRIYPTGARPVVMETTVLEKFIHGSSEPMLRSKGDGTRRVLLFTEDAVRFEDVWLEKVPTDSDFVQTFLGKLRPVE